MSMNTPPSATCGLCSELFVDPRMLQCLHSFCSKCLKKISEEQGSGTSFKCPTCENIATLPERGIGAIQKDIRRSHEADVARVASRMQSEKKKGCDLCIDTSTGPAVSFCHDCGNFLCKTCSDYHKTCRIFLDHKLEPVSSSKSKSLRVSDIPHKPLHCQLHEDEILKFYCETCSSLICRDCMAIEHTGHTYNRLEKVVEKEKASLVSILSSTDLDSIQAKLDNAVVKGSKVIQKVQKEQKSVEEFIESTFKTLTDAVSKRKQVLLGEVSSIKTDMAVQEKKFSALRREIVDTYDMITTATQAYTPVEMLSAKGAMIENLRKLLKQYEEVYSEPCVSDMVSSNFDISVLVKSIGSFGLIVSGSSPENAETDFYIHGAVAGKEKKITITTYDIHGKRFPCGGERVKVMLDSTQTSWNDVEGQIVDNNDGTYVASFTPKDSAYGEYKFSITFDGQHIKGSPFDVCVRDMRDYKQLSSCYYTLSLANQSQPYDIAVDDNDDIYVASSCYNHGLIEVFNDNDSYPTRTVGMDRYGSFFPSAIAIQGNVLYVVERRSHQVQKFTTSGEFVSKFGSQGSGDGQFNQPRGLCVHKDGRVFVSDNGNDRVSIFKADGTFLYHITGSNADDSNLQAPWGVAFDQCGNLHIADTSSRTIKIFSSEG